MLKRLMDPRHKELRATLVLVTLLVMVGSVSPAELRYHPQGDTLLRKMGRTLKKRGLNREASAKQTAGYYEGLLDHSAEVTRVGGRGWLDWEFWFVERQRRATFGSQLKRERDDFIRYDLPPNVNVPDVDDRRRLVTNSFGMADREYSEARPDDTWRVALIGDSVTRGMGAAAGMNFETRLEDRLNEQFAGSGVRRYEILNLAVQGYQLTQMVDVTLDRAPHFSPSAYVVALTDRSVFRVWANHIASVVHNGIDLKYDFLKTIVREAGVTPNLSDALINARLAPYRMAVFRWALGEMKARAARDGAPLVVLLVPTPDDAEQQIEEFRVPKAVLAEMGIPTIDLLETYVDFEDLAPFRVSSADRHPNERGHELLFEALWGRIDADPSLRAAFTGISRAR